MSKSTWSRKGVVLGASVLCFTMAMAGQAMAWEDKDAVGAVVLSIVPEVRIEIDK